MRNEEIIVATQGITYLEMLEIAIRYTVTAIPVLFLTYLLVGFLTNKTNIIQKAKKSPLIWSALGTIPQCGFSAVCADLFNRGMLMTGTLIAVFIATSDEFLPIVLSGGERYDELLIIIGIKFVFGVSLGFILNKTLFKNEKTSDIQHIHTHKHNIFTHAIQRTLRVAVWIFISNMALEIIFKYIDNSVLESWIRTSSVYQILLVGLLSLIPNCCISILISKLFLTKIITIGATITALSCASGFGYVFLFKENPKKCIKILIIIYTSSVVLGVAVDTFLNVFQI